ncbi:MAG: phosphoribosylanthranilate isomerase [Candidatus Diapherotrites archaeon]|uniref:N-(5'-phosphoribosyl)anthranilate isomerase n=1 Tax=Candidatus Iainarchaeum sp. TaxID=3101447 RepID=A0A939C6Q1_9ARCH|nr:phosphoribosylanthranilate isomerase [Candidatus Diapherotrites archaeon]
MVKVKICGVTNAEDGFAAINAGADYLGFVVEIFGAERLVDRAEAKELFDQLHGSAPLVALTDLADAGEIESLCNFVRADAVQLVKPLPLKELHELKLLLPSLKVFKTVHVKDESALAEAKRFGQEADFLVLDSSSGRKLGGTGKKADWKICKKIVEECSKPVFLAGGLTSENVVKAIRQVKPFGVDVSSGVKMQNNKRKIDLNKLKRFIEEAKSQ